MARKSDASTHATRTLNEGNGTKKRTDGHS